MIERCDFSDRRELFANANQEEPGDQFARIGAENLLALERSQCAWQPSRRAKLSRFNTKIMSLPIR
jgi:hypothetical protein